MASPSPQLSGIHPFETLTPDRVLDALETVGLRGDGRLTALDKETGENLWEFQTGTGAGIHADLGTHAAGSGIGAPRRPGTYGADSGTGASTLADHGTRGTDAGTDWAIFPVRCRRSVMSKVTPQIRLRPPKANAARVCNQRKAPSPARRMR